MSNPTRKTRVPIQLEPYQRTKQICHALKIIPHLKLARKFGFVNDNKILLLYRLVGMSQRYEGNVFPSIETLGCSIGIKRKTAEQYLRELAHYGLITKILRTRQDGGRSTNGYLVPLNPTKKFLKTIESECENRISPIPIKTSNSNFQGRLQGGGCLKKAADNRKNDNFSGPHKGTSIAYSTNTYNITTDQKFSVVEDFSPETEKIASLLDIKSNRLSIVARLIDSTDIDTIRQAVNVTLKAKKAGKIKYSIVRYLEGAAHNIHELKQGQEEKEKEKEIRRQENTRVINEIVDTMQTQKARETYKYLLDIDVDSQPTFLQEQLKAQKILALTLSEDEFIKHQLNVAN